jgi:glucose-6-phosphate 1-dehydrogenase
MYNGYDLRSNHCRLRISPYIVFPMDPNSIAADDETVNQPVEITWGHCPHAGEMDAYERVLGDAMMGDSTLFAREDYVEEAWRIVDPVLKDGTPVHEYEPKTWGPAEAEAVAPPGGWQNPVMTDRC